MSQSGRPPLEGIRVVDFSRVIAGPMCTQILSDMGAEVIKIENPDGGDDTRKGAGAAGRRREPLLHDLQQGQEERGARLHQARRAGGGERSCSRRADVLVQNFRPGVLNKYGFDYKSLHEKLPRLIYLSISAYGQSGPLSDRPGYDPVLQAESGMMSVNGEANGEGLRHAIAIVDTMTAIHSVAAINAALFARTQHGQGPAHRSGALRHGALLARQHGLLLSDRRRAAEARRQRPLRVGAQQLVRDQERQDLHGRRQPEAVHRHLQGARPSRMGNRSALRASSPIAWPTSPSSRA